jgi:hypothetical protein
MAAELPPLALLLTTLLTLLTPLLDGSQLCSCLLLELLGPGGQQQPCACGTKAGRLNQHNEVDSAVE